MAETACLAVAVTRGRGTGKTKRKKAKQAKARRAMSGVEYERMRARVRRTTCSEPWTDAVVHHAAEYPPGADATSMRTCRCDNCQGKRWWPANCVGTSGLSYECFLNTLSKWRLKTLPGSTSSINQARLNAARKQGKDCAGGF